MLFTCTKENLSYALGIVSGITGRGMNLPILSNIAIHVKESIVELLVTDLEIAIRVFVRAKVDKTGSFTVPAKTLSDIINLVSENSVTIELKDNEIEVSAGSTNIKIKGSASEDFPVIPEIDEEHSYLINAKQLQESLVSVLVAVARNQIRPELSGVYAGFFVGGKAGLVLAATDSYRLAEKKIEIEQGCDEFFCIIPAKTASEIARLLSLGCEGSEKNVRMWISNNQISIRFNNFEMTSRVVDGTYPDYSQIIPDQFKTTSIIDVSVFVKQIKGAGLFTTSGVNSVSLDVNVAQSSVGISSTSTQTGEYSSEVDVVAEGEENSILLNHRYVLDGLAQIKTDRFKFLLNGSDAPCMFKPENESSYLYLIMPIRK